MLAVLTEGSTDAILSPEVILMKTQFDQGMLSLSSDVEIKISQTQEKNGAKTIYHFSLDWCNENLQDKSALAVFLHFPLRGFQHIWQPGGRMQRFLKPSWAGEFQPYSMTTVDAPVFCLYDGSDKNVRTVAFSETRKVLQFRTGVNEHNGEMEIKATIELAQFNGCNQYQLQIYVDETPCEYSLALEGVRLWWNEICQITPMAVPEAAKQPLYSAWYNFHYDVSAEKIEAEAALAAQYGIKTLIVDDGWQIEKGKDAKGYSYCGDWEIATDKFPDMAGHVKRVQALGIKYMVWYSVPFMGFLSKHWEQYKDKLLYRIDGMGAGVLDPRFPDVRQYLIHTYADALKKYGYDGFKLDFIDLFRDQGKAPLHPDMDCTCVQDAVVALMCGIKDTLMAIKPDILLEFRQHYIGPNMYLFGNMFRVADCPNDSVNNRVGIADIRMLAGGSAVHSDMLMWHNTEKPEDAALQVLGSIFGVVQYSRILADLPESHQKMLKFWIGFTREHQSLLLDNPLRARQPHFLYPVISTENEKEQAVAVYSDLAVAAITGKTVYAINASFAETLCLHTSAAREARLIVYDCMGNPVRKESVTLSKGMNEIAVPRSGLLVIE